MKNRCMLSLLLCGCLLVYALPRLPIHSTGTEFYFSIMWLVFCLLAIAGNLAAVLYTPKNMKGKKNYVKNEKRKRIRSYS